MERRPSLLREEPRDARLLVYGLDQFEALPPLTDERHAHALVWKLAHRLGAQPERVAIEGKSFVDARHRDTHVMQRPQLHVRGGTYVPNTSRRSAQISPRVTSASTAARMSGTRFAVPLAAVTRSVRAFFARPASRLARSLARRVFWRSTTVSST